MKGADAVDLDSDVGTPPLSFAQKRLWFLDQFEPDSPLYNLPVVLDIEGPLDVGTLERALADVLRRHETLRTVFSSQDGEAIPVVQPAQGVKVAVEDLTGAPEAEGEAEVSRRITELLARPFDLACGPLFRAHLLRRSPSLHVFVACVHHIVFDGWSTGVFLREMSALYDAFSKGQPSPLSELPLQYGDYARQQHELLRGKELARQLTYWKQHLASPPPELALSTDRPRPSVPSREGGYRSVELGPEVTRAVELLARAGGATPFMVVLAAYAVLLSRYTGQDDLIIGTPIANRTRREIEGSIGFFVNTLALRIDLSGQPTFRDLLARVATAAIGAYEHQDLPFEKLVEELNPERRPSHSPIFQAFLNFYNMLGGPSTWQSGDVTMSRRRARTGLAKFDLTMNVSRTEVGLMLGLDYAADLYDDSTADRMLRHYRQVLGSVVDDPDLKVTEVALLPSDERRAILDDFNDTARTVSRCCVHEAVSEQAERTPNAVAAVFGTEQVTYGELGQRAGRLGRYLGNLGVGRGAVVGICLERGLDMLVAVLGVLKSGAAYVPFDPEYPVDRLQFMAGDSGVRTLVSQSEIVDRLGTTDARVVCLDRERSDIDACPVETEAPAVCGDDLAYIIYTSGSTGRPKGVEISHAALTNLLDSVRERPGVNAGDVVLAVTTLSFDIAVLELLLPLIAGAQVAMVDRETATDGHRLQRALDDHAVTVMQATPATYRMLIESGWSGSRTMKVLSAGEALSADLAEALLERCGSLWNMYGPTETTVFSTVEHVESTTPVLIGRPIANTQVYVLDGFHEPVPVGVTGELYIGGAGLARGYRGRDELTAERFIQNLLVNVPGDRLYRTGDLARWQPDGRLECLGRVDHQVKIRGFRIELGEIEAVLIRHPGVARAVATVREPVADDKRLAAYVVPQSGASPPSGRDLRDFLGRTLPSFMVPSTVDVLDTFPLTPAGKVDRAALPAPDARASRDDAPAKPRSKVEQQVADIWAEVLRVESVSVDDNFFDLGGHSLLATQVVSRISRSCGVDVPVRMLFDMPTVAELAQGLERRRASFSDPSSRVPEIPRRTSAPLSFAQQRLWFLDRYEPGTALYNMPLALDLEGALDVVVLEDCLTEIVRRHDVLRTVFVSSDGGDPCQIVQPAQRVNLAVDDLSEVPDEGRRSEVARRAEADARAPFDLADGPLFRARLIRLGPSSHTLLGCLHHIVTDGWSNAVFVRELGDLYEALCAGRSSPLPALPLQYADHACDEREQLSGETLDRQLAYWRGRLGAPLPELELPLDHPRPRLRTFEGESVQELLPGGLSLALDELARREGATPFMTLLATYAALLHRYSGQDDLVVGAPVANRTRPELEGLIGLFVNTLPLRIDLTGEPTFRGLLARVRKELLGALEHRDLPFEKLVEELHPVRTTSRNPIVETVLNYQDASGTAGRVRTAGGVTMRRRSVDLGVAKFDLMLDVVRCPEGTKATAVYNRDLFERATMTRVLGHLRTLLGGIVDDPDTKVGHLPMLTGEERRAIVGWTGTASEYPRDLTVAQLFEAQVSVTPDATAVIYADERLTYRELDERAEGLAKRLGIFGVEPDTRVAVCLERCPDLVAALVGVLKAGGAYVPLDADLPVARLTQMLQDSGAVVVLTTSSIADRFVEARLPILCIDCIDADADAGNTAPTAEPSRAAGPSDLAYVMYTSGSTGRAKGVAVPHRAVVRLVKGTNYVEFRSSDVFLQYAPASFDASTFEIWGSLLNGGALVLMPPGPATLHELEDAIRKYQVSTLWLTAALFRQAVDERLQMFETVRQLLTGGDVVPVEQMRKLLERFPECRLVNGYGPTESTTFACCHQVGPADVDAPSVPIGRPIANTRAHVLDRYLQPVSIGVPGELYLGGDGLARGYINQPEQTARRFVSLISPGGAERVYRTGDRVRWRADGVLDFIGRDDRQVKLRGFRIELEEVETALREEPSVRESSVVAQPAAKVGDEKRLVAFVAPTIGQEVDETRLRDTLRRRLPGYMVPSSFVILDELPRTTTGKIDRLALPVPDRVLPREGSSRPATTGRERALCRIWEKVLQLSDIGIGDDFFELGGHSLLAVGLMAEIERAFGVQLPLSSLFADPTIERQARLIDGGGSSTVSAIVPVKNQGSRPAFYLVHGIGGEVLSFAELVKQCHPDQPVFGIRNVSPDGIVDVKATASRYVDELLRLDESGSYRLGGYSAGGAIAYEMAQQLIQRGYHVPMLALIDCSAPAKAREPARLTPAAILRAAINAAYWMVDDDFFRSGRDEMLARVLSKARGWRRGGRSDIRDALSLWKFPEASVPFLEGYIKALQDYEPVRFPGRLTLIRSRALSLWSFGPRDLYWGGLTDRGVDLEVIPGAHDTMLGNPRVARLAAALEVRLREALPKR